jgi:hypothetical protein
MSIQDLGSIGELLGSVLVLLTLLYLARQVRQAQHSMLLSTVQAQRAEVMANFRMAIDSPHLPQILAKVNAGEELDAVEEQRLGSFIALTWATVHATWAQRTLTGATDILAKDDGHFAVLMRGLQERSIEWWNAAGRNIYPEPFIRYVDTKIAAFSQTSLAHEELRGTFGPSRPER